MGSSEKKEVAVRPKLMLILSCRQCTNGLDMFRGCGCIECLHCARCTTYIRCEDCADCIILERSSDVQELFRLRAFERRCRV
jgi:hypothetical protein